MSVKDAFSDSSQVCFYTRSLSVKQHFYSTWSHLLATTNNRIIKLTKFPDFFRITFSNRVLESLICFKNVQYVFDAFFIVNSYSEFDTQVEVPDRKSICPDRNERTRWRRAFKITRSGKKMNAR